MKQIKLVLVLSYISLFLMGCSSTPKTVMTLGAKICNVNPNWKQHGFTVDVKGELLHIAFDNTYLWDKSSNWRLCEK